MTYFKFFKNQLLIILITFILFKILIYNEPIFLFYLYPILYNKRYNILVYSSLLYGFFDINLFLKNIILFLIFDILSLLILKNKNKKYKYRVFLLTFFLYLVLINIFEPMIYNFSRLFNSSIIYLSVIFIYKILLKNCKVKRGVQWKKYMIS